MKRSDIIIAVLAALSFAVSIYFYPMMPEMIASHWNAEGQVNGYMPRFIGVFLMPIISAGLILLFLVIPLIDPMRANIEKFRRYYERFIALILLFLLAVQMQVILWNTGTQISPNTTFPIGLGILFFYTGILCENAKRNWFIGIRTPWTLSNDIVWDKTHKIGGKLFKISGIISIFGVFFQSQAIFFSIIPAVFTGIFTIIYSYIEYRKIIADGRNAGRQNKLGDVS